MINLLGIFIIATVFFFLIVVSLSYFFNFEIKKTLIYSISLFLGIPLIAIILIFILKTPLQQGKIPLMTDLGILLNVFIPPDDLYKPLASIKLDARTSTYSLKFKNKYVGRHAITVSSPRHENMDISSNNNEISLSVNISENSKIISEKQSESDEFQFFGREEYGIFFITYNVPAELPVDKELSAFITISGDLDTFLKKREEGYIRLKKIGDL